MDMSRNTLPLDKIYTVVCEWGGGGVGGEYSTFVIRADTLPPNYTIFNHPVFKALGPEGPDGPKFYSKGIFSQLEGGVLWTLT